MLRFLYVTLLFSLLLWLPVHAEDNFLSPDQAFKLSVTQADDGQLRLNWNISEGYYLYRKQLKVDAEPHGSDLKITFPKGVTKNDEFFGESEVYYGSVDLLVTAPTAQALTIGWQGCADAGLCYSPQSQRVELSQFVQASAPWKISTAEQSPTPSSTASSTASPTPSVAEDQSLADSLSHANLAWMLLVFFGLGLLMTFTPCVLPMIPILSSLIAGSETSAGPSAKRGFMLSLAFVLPMAFTYALLGAAAALAGANLQAMMQNPWVLGVFGMVFVVLATAMFGFYELQLPAFLRHRLNNASNGQRGGTITGAAAMGVVSALLVGPCMTAPLAGALLYIGDTGDVVTGALALLFLGFGMGVPLLFVGTLGAKCLPRPGNWMNRIKVLFGFVLLGTAISFAGRVLPGSVTLALWGALLLAMALSLLTLARKLERDDGRLVTQFFSLTSALWGALMFIGAATGAQNPLQPLALWGSPAVSVQTAGSGNFMTRFTTIRNAQQLAEQVAAAGQRGQWTLVDFSADWCASCKAIERDVFGDPRVQQALDGITLLRPDITANNEDDQAMLRAYKAFGAPTILFIAPDGVEHRAERIIGLLSAEDFLGRLARAQKTTQ